MSIEPTVFYNEYAPFPAQMLRELGATGAIPAGHVDERSIEDVVSSDLDGFDICHFFAGIGVWSYALEHAGWPRSGLRTWTASLPCQPFSQAGKRAGFDDERHLWPVFHRLVQQCAPSVILGEQVASADGLAWLDAVFSDLEDEGFAVAAADTPAAGYGAPQKRQRLYWLAARVGDTAHIQRELQRSRRPESVRWEKPSGERSASDPRGDTAGYWGDAHWVECADGFERPVGPRLRTLADRSPHGVESLRGYGNALNAEAAIGFVRATIQSLEEEG
ncbi:MAG: DNA cytosine methyltransferase [Rhizobiales bacterium]|nr:DNA cytosine methyltransferase [Hyphomicrobiales bacterium]|tara:strand:- start:6717 stop:7544 length:828 start_codon:yes stop_codon:yes gene_type:complete